MENNEVKFPRYLPYGNHVYCVKGYIGDGMEYIKGKCYAERNSTKIYLYTDEKVQVPRFYEKDGKLEFKEPTVPAENFSFEYAYPLSTEVIISETNGDEELYDEHAIMDMNSATSTFVPILNEGDDCLKRLVKHAIREMHVNIHMLKSYMGAKYGISNLKAALISKTKMTVPNFNIWCELLGLDYEVKLIPRDDCKRMPIHLKEPLIYTSCNDSISGIHENEIDEPEEEKEDFDTDIEIEQPEEEDE